MKNFSYSILVCIAHLAIYGTAFKPILLPSSTLSTVFNPLQNHQELFASALNTVFFGRFKNLFKKPEPKVAIAHVTSKLSRVDVLIVGAGLAGLMCARSISAQQPSCNLRIIEANNAVGGRVRSIQYEGYTLDIGFQVFIDAYPEARKAFDYDSLKLRAFQPGAIIRYQNAFHVVSDPFRRPQDIVASLFNPIGSLLDKIKVSYPNATFFIHYKKICYLV
jgi:hypothetical protein